VTNVLSGEVEFSTLLDQAVVASRRSEHSQEELAISIRTGRDNSIRASTAARMISLAHYGSIIGIVGRSNHHPVRRFWNENAV